MRACYNGGCVRHGEGIRRTSPFEGRRRDPSRGERQQVNRERAMQRSREVVRSRQVESFTMCGNGASAHPVTVIDGALRAISTRSVPAVSELGTGTTGGVSVRCDIQQGQPSSQEHVDPTPSIAFAVRSEPREDFRGVGGPERASGVLWQQSLPSSSAGGLTSPRTAQLQLERTTAGDEHAHRDTGIAGISSRPAATVALRRASNPVGAVADMMDPFQRAETNA